MLKKILLASLAFCCTSILSGQERNRLLQNQFDRAAVFDEISRLVEQNFFDPEFDVEKWKARSATYRRDAIQAETLDDFANVINRLLATLGSSHTYYFSRLNPRRYQLLGIMHEVFEGKGENLFVYEGIGIRTRQIDGQTFVTAVYDGMPAARSGIQFGDQIAAVDKRPFHPIASFVGKADRPVMIDIVRRGRAESIEVVVERLDGRTIFETALNASARIIERDEKQIAYLHVWSYAGLKFQEQIRSLLLWDKLSKCDALVLDLRDGWGGADVNYLNLFRPPIVHVESSSRTQPTRNFSGVWGKPVVLIVNGGSTSGKELFAYGFKKLKLGTVVGEKSAGAVVAGRCFLLSNGDLLYLAVMDIRVDGKRLEGIGVKPDIEVIRRVRDADQGDPQLERAVEILLPR